MGLQGPRGTARVRARSTRSPIAKDKEGEAPFSVDANLLHSSSEGKVLEDPAKEAPAIVYQRTISPMEAPDKPTEIRIGFAKGDAVSIDGEKLSPATLLAKLNKLGHDNGIGRLDLVENRFVGMKSRGVYETPGGTILLAAHRAIESITLDRGAGHLKDELMPRYAELIYNGFWFSPEREMLQALIDKSQEMVEGEVRLKLYKGNVIVTGRESPASLYSSTLVTFEDDKGAYDQKDAEGFIKLNALRLRTLGQRRKSSSSIDRRRHDLEASDGRQCSKHVCFRRWRALALAALRVGQQEGPEPEPNIFPTNYKQEILDTLTRVLDDPTNVRDAFITEPALRTVNKEQRYTVCVRYNAATQTANTSAARTASPISIGGHLNQLVEATKEQCGKAAYKPFPELEKLCLAKGE